MPVSVGPDVRIPPGFSKNQTQIAFLIFFVEAMLMSGNPAITLTSWYRTPERNREVGGVPNSLHVQGLAIDLFKPRGNAAFQAIETVRDFFGASTPSTAPLQVMAAWRALGLQGFDEGDHVHLEFQAL